MGPLTQQELEEASSFLQKKIDFPLQVGIVLGSGLGSFVSELQKVTSLPYTEIPHFPKSSVPGHSGVFHFGFLDGISLAIMQGRIHYYEGHHPSRVVFGIRLMGQLGVRNLILTNAAGAINENFKPGDFMLILDHINLTGNNPLIGQNFTTAGDIFVDMSKAYDPLFANYARKAAEKLNIPLHSGIYCGLSGPSYETPAEIRMLKILGADAVGMSTVYETIVARQMQMRVLGLSLISNMAAGILKENLAHQEVLDIAKVRQNDFAKLLKEVIYEIDKE